MRREGGKGRADRWTERGMTLVELMVIVAIVAIIAAIAITLFQEVQKKTKMAADLGTAATMRSSVAIYYGKHNGNFPSDRATVNSLTVPQVSWQCSTSVPAVYDSGNGKVTLSLALSDCP